jgi:hypothetical protein
LQVTTSTERPGGTTIGGADELGDAAGAAEAESGGAGGGGEADGSGVGGEEADGETMGALEAAGGGACTAACVGREASFTPMMVRPATTKALTTPTAIQGPVPERRGMTKVGAWARTGGGA